MVLRQKILAAFLATAFFVAGNAFLDAYDRCRHGKAQLESVMRQEQILISRQRKMKHMSTQAQQVRQFVDQAQAHGLVKDQWATYDVNIDESVPFPVAAQLLSDTSPASSYYFKPISLHMKKNPSSVGAKTHTEDRQGVSEGDLKVTLKGTFVVRNE